MADLLIYGRQWSAGTNIDAAIRLQTRYFDALIEISLSCRRWRCRLSTPFCQMLHQAWWVTSPVSVWAMLFVGQKNADFADVETRFEDGFDRIFSPNRDLRCLSWLTVPATAQPSTSCLLVYHTFLERLDLYCRRHLLYAMLVRRQWTPAAS